MEVSQIEEVSTNNQAKEASPVNDYPQAQKESQKKFVNS